MEVIFNSRLSFDACINDKVSKASKILGLIRGTSTIMNEVTFLQQYEAFVRPHLEFSNCVGSPSLRKHIENVQRRVTKPVSSVSHLSHPDRLVRLNLPTLSHRRAEKADMIEVFKITSNITIQR